MAPWAAIILVMAGAATAVQAAPDPAVSCSATLTGTVSALVVPSGATCTASHLVVTGDVTIEPGATLQSAEPWQCDPALANPFTVGGRITIAADGVLMVRSTALSVGDDVRAQAARTLVLVRIPCQGATGVVGGDVLAGGTKAVSVLGLHVGGSVFVGNSGANGIEVGSNDITSGLWVQNNTVIGAQSPSPFSVGDNRVARGVVIVGNDATGAYVPPFVGANTVTNGNLVCEHNTPDLTDQTPDDTLPNEVPAGQKLGQCRGL